MTGRFAPHLFRALRSRNYRLFFIGQGVSLVGSWMTQVATSWLVYRLSGSPVLLGLNGFATHLPIGLMAPVSGVLADRWDRRRLLVIMQVLAMAHALALAVLTLAGVIQVWHVIALSVVQGVIHGFEIPARQAFVIELVDDPSDLSNAIALNSSIFNGARLIGPSIAGILIAQVGEGLCFLLDGISYIAVIAALVALAIPRRVQQGPTAPLVQDIREGLAYVVRFAPIRAILVLVGLTSLLGMVPVTVLMPVVARDVLGGDAHTFGFLMGMSGFGALAGALYLAARRTVLGLGRLIVLSSWLFGTSLIAFGCSRYLWLAVPLMFLVGFGMLLQMAACNTVVQTLVDDDKRGRVMSFYALAVLGAAPLGSLLAGWLATRIGAAETIVAGGIACALAGLAFSRELPALRPLIRPIYIRKGIIPEVAAGVQTAANLASSEE